MNWTKLAAFCLAVVAVVGSPSAAAAQARHPSPQHVADELLAADRSFAAAAAGVDTVTALSAMFADDVVMPLPTGSFARGRAAAVEALRGNPFNLASRTEWAPVRGGVSADGQHGFTFGFMTLRGDDGSTRLARYLSYWVRTPQGWRVAAYKRSPRTEGEVSLALMAPSLPDWLVPPTTDAGVVNAHRESLRAAEQAFSDEAQRIGIGPAFARNGAADSVIILGPQPGFIVGAETIGRNNAAAAGSATGSPVRWSADDTLAASSGDLGVSWGKIRANGTPPSESAFFTIWRRPGGQGSWHYIAE